MKETVVFKAMILLKRNEGTDHQEFRNWWIGQHAALARQLPGVKRLCFNVVETENAFYDGIAELWFETKEDFESAYQTDIGKAVAEDSMANVSRRDRLFVQEIQIAGK